MNLAEFTILALEVNARCSANKEGAVGAGEQALDNVAAQAIGRAKLLEFPAVVAIEPILRAYPQVARAVLRHAIDIQISQTHGGGTEAVQLAGAGRHGETQCCEHAHTGLE